MKESLEDYILFLEAEKRVKAVNVEQMSTHEEVIAELGITPSELEKINVEIE